MKNIILILLVTFVGFSVQAQEKKNKNAKYSITVNGNCEQCQRRIQKAAFSVDGVKTANWSIETHKLDLIINTEKTSIDDVKKAIAKVGHDTDEVKTTDGIYSSLPSCCKYDREKTTK
ncbi:heavy-metal-associated domain-containing protein [Flavobacterium soyangense]|uniref:Cation transporter n=1 Tax=Flavobacterium soyangense TaxID=2023265 RepID=A0A930UCJ1_9FLAO|nr:cation transporter [Flavobacterium soyangense]MBF2708806.1 cation transporter [Flavobacterium soyangense]